MADCIIKTPPVFSESLRKWDRDTEADGQAMGEDIEKLFNNTIYNKSMVEQAMGKRLKGITIPTSGWENLEFEITDADIRADSTIFIGYAFDSIPAAQKTNIRGRAEDGKLVLVAAKMPEQELIIDEVRILNPMEG